MIYLFADEAGDLIFKRPPEGSRYFILCTVLTSSLDLCVGLAELRRKLIWEGRKLGDWFHATDDHPDVRDRVFNELLKHDFTVQATICEKSKAQPQVRRSKARFYQYPWYYHFSYGLAKRFSSNDELFITAASVGSRKERKVFSEAIADVMGQHLSTDCWRVDFRVAKADYGLQAVDYCAWALQRAWERDDNKYLQRIRPPISYEYDLWNHGTKHYY
ncbi:DUF3800 domain-containing protein [Thermaurantiacus tibetensis]|uniref:DUF3800 domain-containing protein n=1 Tax=Thermaurantiacus tibetensis TaxID=2759035 RepID=UPI00188E4AC7|nr:DUF3800 domain-containing protein [Thermaurantiacus tibetensis]